MYSSTISLYYIAKPPTSLLTLMKFLVLRGTDASHHTCICNNQKSTHLRTLAFAKIHLWMWCFILEPKLYTFIPLDVWNVFPIPTNHSMNGIGTNSQPLGTAKLSSKHKPIICENKCFTNARTSWAHKHRQRYLHALQSVSAINSTLTSKGIPALADMA